MRPIRLTDAGVAAERDRGGEAIRVMADRSADNAHKKAPSWHGGSEGDWMAVGWWWLPGDRANRIWLGGAIGLKPIEIG